MRYARNVNGTYFDYIDIPQPWPAGYWTNDPVVFCQKMFPGTLGWEHVADDAGTVTPTAQPAVLSWGDLANLLIKLLSGANPLSTGRAALGVIIKNCQASALGGDNYFAVYFLGQYTFTKAEFTTVLADVAVGIVSGAQKTAVSNNWPPA